MTMPIPQNLLLLVVAAFLLGWLLASVSASLTARYKAKKRDSRDEVIRSLEAELHVAQTEIERQKSGADAQEDSLRETTSDLHKRDTVITEQRMMIDRLGKDLKGSVKKTRELRAEVADRATQNVHAEAKIREVETELSLARASADLMATGVLAYGEDFGEDDPSGDAAESSKATKAAG
jgi:chromosome segregation ATPase